MLEIENPRIEIVEMSDDNTYGKFVVEPLERGYGITLGNSLRRILLSFRCRGRLLPRLKLTASCTSFQPFRESWRT